MGKSSIKIGSYEIDDAHLSSDEAKSGDTVHIPCQSDPGLCMQLDAWDDHISVPAVLNGQHSILYKDKYDKHKDEWVLRFE